MATQFQNVPDYSKLDLSLPCATDLSALQYKAVLLSSGEVVVAGSGSQALGLLQNAPNTSGPNNSPIAQVRNVGNSKYLVGGTVTSGQFLKPNTDGSGSLIPVTADKDAYCALAIGDASTGDIAVCAMVFGTVSM